jgi:hypothetical protein
MRKQSWFGIAFLFQDWVLIYHRLVYCLSFILWQLGPNYHNFLQLLWIKVPVSLMIVLVPITKHIRMCEINDACASLDLKLKSRKCQFEKTWSYCWNHSSWQLLLSAVPSILPFPICIIHHTISCRRRRTANTPTTSGYYVSTGAFILLSNSLLVFWC